MGTRAMKKDLFTIKAVESKGYDIKELIELPENELDNLPLPMKIIEAIKEYRDRGGKTVDQIAEEIADIMMTEEVQHGALEAAQEYKHNTTEQQEIIEQIESTVVVPDDEVLVVREPSSQDDVDTINVALKEKEFKSFAPYMKHLKSAVPAQILTSVDGATVNELIEKRISEVKEDAEKN